MSEKNNEVSKVLNALASDPSKMNDMLKNGTEGVVRGILADEKLSDSEVSEITRQVSENNIMKLYLGAEGQIDAANLMKLTGGFNSKPDGVTRASGIGALLDGKLDANDLLAVMNMLQSTSGNNTAAQQSSPTGGLLSALLGGGAQPQQAQQPQQNSTGSLLGNLFGGGQTQQPQTQTTSANATVTLSGMQLAQIMQMFTKEQLKITQEQAKQSVTLNGSQLKQMLNQLGGKVYTSSKQTVTLTGLQLAQIMSMLGSGNVQITQAQASQNITLNAKQMGQLMSQLTGQSAAAAVNQQPASAPANNGAGQIFSLNGNNTAAQNTSSAGNLNSLMNLASLLMGKK